MPKSAWGFTLVELLVVVSIIAILSVIGITVFSAAQKTARDGHRRSEIDAIAKAMEVHFQNGLYECVKNPWFQGGSTDSTPYQDPSDSSVYAGLPGCGAGTPGAVSCGSVPGPYCFTAWKVCADLEADGRGASDTTAGDGVNTNDFCRSNQQ